MAIVELTACAHPNRVPPGALRRLTKKSAPFVLVFGSLAAPAGRPARPMLRFVYQSDRSHPEYLLDSLRPSAGKRFYAVLEPPRDLAQTVPWLDHFYLEAGSAESGFDRILYVHLQRLQAPLAMYLGEIHIVPAQNRAAGGEKLSVSVLDDFRDATLELRKLYPKFAGTLDNQARLLPNASPGAPPPERIR